MLVVEHDRRATGRTRAQLQRTIGVVGIERLTIQTRHVVRVEVIVVEEAHMRAVLPRNALTNRAMAGVVVDRVVVGMGMNVVAPARMIVCHGIFPLFIRVDEIGVQAVRL